jgi:hypothetical protein
MPWVKVDAPVQTESWVRRFKLEWVEMVDGWRFVLVVSIETSLILRL